MKALGRLVMTAILAVAALFIGSGTASAGMDNSNTLVDGHDRTLVIEQWDTFLNGVFPLDRNRLTREWFHSGRAKYNVSGPGADDFEGVLELGYQVGFPWSLGVGINFSYTTPNIALDGYSFGGLGLAADGAGVIGGVTSPPLLPGVSISADLGNGPGIQEVATFSVDIKGSHGAVAVSNAHGTVTGAAGGVLLRPFARLIANTGDSVTTYGEPWNMN
ncbi:porin MspA [Mycolicibacterium insubricum]|uniref:MspA family porin n=1 Tax=Mycolicibacterium insubricum TaxID=444597 RepID=UPI00138CFFAE|nr:MspA family porin [Mycolicibacterium insubricum]MCB9441925.1 MspA family porin [Mycolicibacterium sp.]BBZ68547.1 porin MspA [Mycolicibacterium insubricum]